MSRDVHFVEITYALYTASSEQVTEIGHTHNF
jgi:hypothetical protein